MPYCIYTDREVAEADGNLDHIVPLSAGGLDAFCVWSDRQYNSQVGSRVDGAIANDFLFSLARKSANARGHSRSTPVPSLKNSSIAGRPTQIRFEKDGVVAWDARTKSLVDNLEGAEIESKFRIDRWAAARFAAKAALGTAYFVYGDAIRSAIDCDQLRKLVSLDPVEAKKNELLIPETLTICDRFHPDANGQSHTGTHFRMLTEFTARSTVFLFPQNDAITFGVGLLGQFMALIDCPGNVEGLPRDSLQDLGHTILLQPGPMERVSFRDLNARLLQSVEAGADRSQEQESS